MAEEEADRDLVPMAVDLRTNDGGGKESILDDSSLLRGMDLVVKAYVHFLPVYESHDVAAAVSREDDHSIQEEAAHTHVAVDGARDDVRHS